MPKTGIVPTTISANVLTVVHIMSSHIPDEKPDEDDSKATKDGAVEPQKHGTPRAYFAAPCQVDVGQVEATVVTAQVGIEAVHAELWISEVPNCGRPRLTASL